MSDGTSSEIPVHRYNAALARVIETKWQDRWETDKTFHAPNPGEDGFDPSKPKRFIMDMFPYPSGAGLHVGHPLGYIATDIYARYLRMTGHNVLHPMGFDAFGLPAEQYAIQTGQHPRITTERNIATMRRQMRALGLGHDPDRFVATTDVEFYKWTQWIFLKIFGAWYDERADRARPIEELVRQLESGERSPSDGTSWAELSQSERDAYVDRQRLAYVDKIPVNWCPGLGTVLANEEVTADGKSERGNFPVYKRPLRQWIMRITAYCERMLTDLEPLAWPEPIKLMQRNWIGRSEGADVDFEAGSESIRVFTTRPDTLYGATYMVLAPEHPLVDKLTADTWPDGAPEAWRGQFPSRPEGDLSPSEMVAAYKRFAESRSDIERQVDEKTKTGVFIGTYATNPVNDAPVPIFIADYVLMGYGTGAIMAVPAHDTRDWDFATQFEIDIIEVVKIPEGHPGVAEKVFVGEGVAVNSSVIEGLPTAKAKTKITAWLEERGVGKGTINYRLRDWLFSRQRYWGEPFPIIFDENDRPIAVDESELPVELPEVDDYKPETDAPPDSPPRPPLARAAEWSTVTIDGKTYRRELNTMPNWAGSCWYYLRYLDPENTERYSAEAVERYWMLSGKDGEARPEKFDPQTCHIGGVDLYVGGAEHAVLHLLYSRFWHKVLFDLGHVSTPEPFGRLFNQGYVQAAAYTDERNFYVPAEQVEEKDGKYFFDGEEVKREFGKMGKSLKNAVTPDEICNDYGADTLRLYEMYMGPLEASKPWNTRDIIGSHRFLQRLWRNFVDEVTGSLKISDAAADDELRKALHKTIDGVRADMESLGFNTAIAKLIELNNRLTSLPAIPREIAEALVRMVAPLAPHFAEELWEKMGSSETIAYADFPVADPALLVDDSIEIPVQIMGKVRTKINVAPGLDKDALEAAAKSDSKVQELLEGKTVRKVIAVPDRLVNFVAN
jgi:leucyl-tRNA synthetase